MERIASADRNNIERYRAVTEKDEDGKAPKVEPSYKKIMGLCEEAKKQNITWIWMDSICMDKTDSAEQDESIISMFEWYKRAAMCFVYLADVKRTSLSQDRPIEWFSRG